MEWLPISRAKDDDRDIFDGKSVDLCFSYKGGIFRAPDCFWSINYETWNFDGYPIDPDYKIRHYMIVELPRDLPQ